MNRERHPMQFRADNTRQRIKLPKTILIDNKTHLQMWRSETHAIYQNTDPTHGSRRSVFKVYSVEQIGELSEALGEKLGTFHDIDKAVDSLAAAPTQLESELTKGV